MTSAGKAKAAQWVELSITVTPELVEPLTELFVKRGKAAVSIEEPPSEESGHWLSAAGGPPASVTVRAYLPAGVAGQRRRASIEAGIALLGMIVPMPPLQVRAVDAEEWESVLRGHFTTMRAGEHLVIRPVWEDYEKQPGEVVVALDPGAAFGTGHHPTTRLCLELIEKAVTPGLTVLDVGTGSGILAIAAAHLGAGPVLGVDTDPLAVKMARRNARANGLQKDVRLQRGSLPLADGRQFDLVVANITAGVLGTIMPLLRQCVAPKGLLLLSGILQEQLTGVLEKAEACGLSTPEIRTDGDWVAILLSPDLRAIL